MYTCFILLFCSANNSILHLLSAQEAESLLVEYDSSTVTDISEYDIFVENPPTSGGDLRRDQVVANQDILAAYSTFPGLYCPSEYDISVEPPSPTSAGDLRREQVVFNQDIVAAYSTFPGLSGYDITLEHPPPPPKKKIKKQGVANQDIVAAYSTWDT